MLCGLTAAGGRVRGERLAVFVGLGLRKELGWEGRAVGEKKNDICFVCLCELDTDQDREVKLFHILIF